MLEKFVIIKYTFIMSPQNEIMHTYNPSILRKTQEDHLTPEDHHT